MSFARKDNVASSIIYCYAFITGDDLKKGKCNNDNLKEIFMDDSEFYTCHHLILDALADLKTPRFKDACIFEYCNKALERVSIRNAKSPYFWGTIGSNPTGGFDQVRSQNSHLALVPK